MSISGDIFHRDNLTSVITTRKSSCGKVMFSQVSVILFRGRGDPHVTITPHLHIRHGTELLPCYWHLVVINGDLFQLVHLKTYPKYWHRVSGNRSGWYASYWNAVLSAIVNRFILGIDFCSNITTYFANLPIQSTTNCFRDFSSDFCEPDIETLLRKFKECLGYLYEADS